MAKESLCWNCKRACCNPDHTCDWARFGRPVEGWTAEQGRAYQIFVPEEERDNPDEAYKTEYGYLVTACPLYEREHRWFTHKEAVEEICKTLGIVDSSFRHRPAQYMRRYETITGEKLPVWMWSAVECK